MVFHQANTHSHNVSIHSPPLTQLPKLFFMQHFHAFVNEWTLELLYNTMDMPIKQQYLTMSKTTTKLPTEKQ